MPKAVLMGKIEAAVVMERKEAIMSRLGSRYIEIRDKEIDLIFGLSKIDVLPTGMKIPNAVEIRIASLVEGEKRGKR